MQLDIHLVALVTNTGSSKPYSHLPRNRYESMTMRNQTLLLIALLMSVLAMSCTQEPRTDEAAEGDSTYHVAATVGMVSDIVKNVAGDRATVTTIVGAGVDPHLYTPTRGDIAEFQKADVVFYSGLLLEGKMTDLFERLAEDKPVYAVTDLIDEEYLLPISAGHFDPHVWMDPKGWTKATEAVVASLSEVDPAHAAEYKAYGAAYLNQLADLDNYATERLATIPDNARVMVTAHDAFGYLGRAYGLEVIGIQGISTDSEAGLQDINRIVDLLVERNVPSVFVESSVSEKNVEALVEGARSRGHEVEIGGSLFSDAMGKSGTYEGSYVGMIDHNVTTITRALGGDAPERGMQGKLGGEGH